MAKFLFYALPFILALYALIDCAQTPAAEVRSLPKPAWLALIVLVFLAGPIAWLLGGRPRGTGPSPLWDRMRPDPPSRAAPPRGQVAPDDDPDFLRRLDAEQRRRDRDRRRAEGGTDPGEQPTS